VLRQPWLRRVPPDRDFHGRCARFVVAYRVGEAGIVSLFEHGLNYIRPFFIV
jgi:hypothetical protein